MKTLTFDIMSNGRFVHTMRIPLTLDIIEGYEGDMPILNAEKLKQCVETRMPTLKYEKYEICF